MEGLEAKRARRISLFPTGSATPAHRIHKGTPDATRIADTTAASVDVSAGEAVPVAPDLLNITWKVHRLTPLHNFVSDASHLKAYSQSLTALLRAQSRIGQGVAVTLPESEAGLSDSLDARISVLKNVAVSPEDPDAIQIIVTKPSEAEAQQTLKVILCSVGTPLAGAQQAGFVHLPVGLLKGSAAIGRHVFSWLQSSFDCMVLPLNFTPVDLVWIAAEWAAAEADDPAGAQRPLVLGYRPPESVTQISNISLSIEADSMRELIAANQASTDESVMEDQALLERLETHIFNVFRLKLAAMRLSHVSTFVASVSYDGRLKLLKLPQHRQEDVLLALNYVTYVACRS